MWDDAGMSRRHFSLHYRFLALRACWTILHGGSVAYGINFTGGGGFESLSEPLFMLDCQKNGKPMTHWDLEFSDPKPQPD